ncbi:cyclic nucleotide-binding domain-containing protein [Hymenobacter sp. NST-14]|uniref:cyclic nucleotide-binding domain-containing protein n=1 Tax=Hymenobacter piscis TaxID=2839984 RepID=UPI001C021EC2|nr:cyclic nucleotide-binding domain-containing protein [Hymenobacter piscis]MBT9393982.1 cyclic nucleotide-binding domain-containing protein [Hymenobacter piscis]
MTLLARWQQLLGIRPEEGRTVGLFFLHNFLLGIGTILVYVAANVILLENHPETSLPLAYGAAALAMMAAGQAYAHFEHRLGLQTVAVRVLGAVVVLMLVIGVLVALGQSVGAAVAIMTGYRVIYLLTNLEFWGVSAVVFDVRQGRRLFSVISSGDMPAKALGAVLAVLVHHHAELLWLLLLAFGAYVGALLVLRATGREHAVEVRSAARAARQQAVAAPLQRWLGSSRLVLTMCLSLLVVAAVTTGIEYAFFINVKERFHDQALVMRYVGTVLTLTYLLAMLMKLVVTGKALDRLGVRPVLLALPLVLLSGLGFFGLGGATGPGGLMLYVCGLFLVQEVLRRAFFDPVFLVLFQPLPAEERLQAHTLVKGLYEPLGMGLAGLLLWLTPAASLGFTVSWMAGLLVVAGGLLYRTYQHYLSELHHAVSPRFGGPEPAAPAETPAAAAGVSTGRAAAAVTEADVQALVEALADKTTRAAATEQLRDLGAAALPVLIETLRTHANPAVVRRVATLCGSLPQAASRRALLELARQPDLTKREAALRALRHRAPDPAETPELRELVQQELLLARELLHGRARNTLPALDAALSYELQRVQRRLFGLLLLLYPPRPILDAQRHVAHAARERQANALEILDNLIDRPTYQGLQTLLEVGAAAAKAARFDRLLPAAPAPAPLLATILERGEAGFSDWTVSRALDQWPAADIRMSRLEPHLASGSPLVQESARSALARWADARPTAYQAVLVPQPSLAHHLLMHHAAAAHVSAADRVAVLQQTALFAETPANVLSAIVPIMQEVEFGAGESIFAKGDLGTSLFIVHAGEVGIFTGSRQLATFRAGDFFGELALLDAEPRSAAAVAQTPTRAFRLDQEDFYDVMEERPEVLRNILRVLCQRLRRQNETGEVK